VSTPQIPSLPNSGSTQSAESPLPLASSSPTPPVDIPSYTLPPISSSSYPSYPTPLLGGRRRGLLLVLIALVMLVLLGSSLGAFYWFSHPTPVVTTKRVVGDVSFLSSGLGNEQSSQGINDELQIDLHHLSPPAPGKALYAWLLSDKKVI